MSRSILTAACVAALSMAACTDTAGGNNALGGALVGAAFGTVTAKMLDADDRWTILGALAGASVGALVAQNTATNECAYARGDGTYIVRPCP